MPIPFDQLQQRHEALMAEHRAFQRRSLWRLIWLGVFILGVFLMALNVRLGVPVHPPDLGASLDRAGCLGSGTIYFLALFAIVLAGLTGIVIWATLIRNRIVRLTIELMDLCYTLGQLVERQEGSRPPSGPARS